MSAFNEFELLEVSEDLEPGDYISVEDSDSGETMSMVYVRKDKTNVLLRDAAGTTFKFCQRTLELQGDDSWIIVGKE